jgi:hypothetical protein
MSELERFREKVYCRKCNTNTNHGIIYKHSIGEDVYENGYFWSEDYIISQCMGCDTVGFIKDYDDITMHFFNYDTHEPIDLDDITVYPPEPLNKKDNNNNYNMVEFQHLPELLNTLYRQVVANFELRHYLLAAAGLRMIIEGICNDRSITKGYVINDETGIIETDKEGNRIQSKNLNGKINGLVEQGILTEGQTAILHMIRKLGNQTVHKLNNPKKKILLDGLEIVEHTFRNIYELKKFDNLAKQFK